MKKIIAVNTKTGITYQAQESHFASYEELLAWRDEQISNNSWGKPEREIIEFSESYDEVDVLSRRSEAVGEGVVNYVTLRAEYTITEEDITDAYNTEKLLNETIANGERAENACKRVKQYVTGYNMTRALTAEQVSSFISTFGNIQLALDANRPNTSRVLIEAVQIDGTIVTDTLKNNCLAILTKFGF